MARQMQKSKATVKNSNEPKLEEEVIVETTIEPTPKPQRKVQPPIARDNYILCRSVIAGGLHINCKSGNTYSFKDYGSECDIEYYDLIALIRKHSEHIFLPRIIIEDEEFLADFPQIQEAYDNAYSREDLIEILRLPQSQMEAAVKSLPETTVDTMRKLITTEIANGHIDSVKKIRFLGEYYDSDFNLISELFGN